MDRAQTEVGISQDRFLAARVIEQGRELLAAFSE